MVKLIKFLEIHWDFIKREFPVTKKTFFALAFTFVKIVDIAVGA